MFSSISWPESSGLVVWLNKAGDNKLCCSPSPPSTHLHEPYQHRRCCPSLPLARHPLNWTTTIKEENGGDVDLSEDEVGHENDAASPARGSSGHFSRPRARFGEAASRDERHGQNVVVPGTESVASFDSDSDDSGVAQSQVLLCAAWGREGGRDRETQRDRDWDRARSRRGAVYFVCARFFVRNWAP